MHSIDSRRNRARRRGRRARAPASPPRTAATMPRTPRMRPRASSSPSSSPTSSRSIGGSGRGEEVGQGEQERSGPAHRAGRFAVKKRRPRSRTCRRPNSSSRARSDPDRRAEQAQRRWRSSRASSRRSAAIEKRRGRPLGGPSLQRGLNGLGVAMGRDSSHLPRIAGARVGFRSAPARRSTDPGAPQRKAGWPFSAQA